MVKQMSKTNLAKKTAVNLFIGMFLQAMLALAFETGGIVSGTITSFLMDTQRIKWIILIYGPLLAARGDIAILAGKLGTGLHLGSVKPTFRNNTPAYRSLVTSTLTIAMLDAVLVGIVTYFVNLIIFPVGIRVVNPTLFLVIPVLVMSVTALLSIQITSAVSFFVYKKGLNPDVYVVPVMSTTNNILITLIYAGVLAILKPWGPLTTVEGVGDVFAVASGSDLLGTYIAIIPAVLAIAGIIYVIIKNIKDLEYKKIMKEATFAIVASVVIGTITGLVLTKGEAALELYPQLLVAIPALINTVVDQNAIFANILITDFSAGSVEPEIKSVRKPKIWAVFLGIGAGGLVVTLFLGIIGTLIKLGNVRIISEELGVAIIWLILLVSVITLIANILAFLLVGSLIFVLAILAFKKEIDPDNFAIPLTACLADLATVAFLIVFAYAILPGVSGHETAAEAIRVLVSTTAIL